MIELTKLYLSDRLWRFRRLWILPLIYQSLNTLSSTILTILIPYTPLNLIIFSLIFIILLMFNPWHLSDQITYQCLSTQSVPIYQFSWTALIKNTYYIYLSMAFLFNYDTIYYLRSGWD